MTQKTILHETNTRRKKNKFAFFNFSRFHARAIYCITIRYTYLIYSIRIDNYFTYYTSTVSNFLYITIAHAYTYTRTRDAKTNEKPQLFKNQYFTFFQYDFLTN